MIKVNYNQETGKVISFEKDIKPYIEITEQERKQPLPDKYSYYAVIDGKFVINRRTPSAEELIVDNKQIVLKEIKELKQKLFDTDYQAIKYAEGQLTADEYGATKIQRQVWRNRINELEESLAPIGEE